MKKYITGSLLLSLTPLLLQGCMSNTGRDAKPQSLTETHKDNAFEKKLSVLKKKNPEQDAKRAIGQGNRTFLVKAGRGLNIPGVSAAQYEQVKRVCGLNYADGFGDVIYGEKHRQYYSAFVEYATRYNTVILTACR